LHLVQARFDQDRDTAAPQGEVGCLPRSQEAGAEGDVDLEVGELRPEPVRLYASSTRERCGVGGQGRC